MKIVVFSYPWRRSRLLQQTINMFAVRCCLRLRLKYILATICTLYLLEFFGVFTHLFELNFDTEFHYPIEGDVQKYAGQMRRGEKPDIEPINIYNYTFLEPCRHKCMSNDEMIAPRLVFIVKSARSHLGRRDAIRKSWGFENRFSDVIVRTVFMLGISKNKPSEDAPDYEESRLIDIEMEQYKDIVQADFIDTYFNNTIKTMMGLKWAITYCPRSKFYMFVDDDFYVSTKNVLRFVRNPVNYPEYLEEADETLRKLARRLSQTNVQNSSDEHDVNELKNIVIKHDLHNTMNNKGHMNEIKKFIKSHEDRQYQREMKLKDVKQELHNPASRKLLEFELPNDVKLFTGFLFSSSPHRHKSSKWHVSLEEYPWNMWPPYVTAGAYILSRETLIQFYFVSMFTKHFRFDDIFMGIVALKAGIEPLHSEEFYMYKAAYYGSHSYRYVLASHGYSDSDEMLQIWSEARAAGHA